MKSFTLLLSLLGLSIASPLTIIHRDIAGTASQNHPDILRACEEADNCETLDGPFGRRIAFKPGQEPGSANYAHRFHKGPDAGDWAEGSVIKARANGDVTTRIQMGPRKINYGTWEPYDALEQLRVSQACTPTSCSSEGKTLTTKIILGQACEPDKNQAQLKVTPDDTTFWDQKERDDYFEVLKNLLSQAIEDKPAEWSLIGRSRSCILHQTEHHQGNFVSITQWKEDEDGHHLLMGQLSVTIEQNTPEDDSCQQAAKALGAAAGALSGIAGGIFAGAEMICDEIAPKKGG